MFDNGSAPTEGLFIPGTKVKVVAFSPKRRDKFLIVYPRAIEELSDCQLQTFLKLLVIANYENLVYASLKELSKYFNISSQAVHFRIQPLRGKALIGRLPRLFLNPFYGTKCSADVLTDLRDKWVQLSGKSDPEIQLGGLNPDEEIETLN